MGYGYIFVAQQRRGCAIRLKALWAPSYSI